MNLKQCEMLNKYENMCSADYFGNKTLVQLCNMGLHHQHFALSSFRECGGLVLMLQSLDREVRGSKSTSAVLCS